MRTAIKNSGGVKGSLLIPEAPFELLVRRAIGQLLAPALQCKEFVAGELMRIAGQCAPRDVRRFPALQVGPLSPPLSDTSEGGLTCNGLSLRESSRSKAVSGSADLVFFVGCMGTPGSACRGFMVWQA